MKKMLNGLIKSGRAYEIGQKHAYKGANSKEVWNRASHLPMFTDDQACAFSQYIAGIKDYEEGHVCLHLCFRHKKAEKAEKAGYYPPCYENFSDDCLGNYA